MPKNKPILVTGSHRSGTTWVGKMIAVSPDVTYIHEPFNLTHDPVICGAKFDYWFTYITEENQAQYYRHLKNTVTFHYNLIGELRKIKTGKGLRRVVGDGYLRFYKLHSRGIRPLVKDPIALFSAEWLAKTFDMDVIALIRHPAAFAGSLKKMNWTHDFSHFLKQPLLMRDHLYPFEKEIREYADQRHDIIDQAILLWKLIHTMIIKYQNKHRDWMFIRHEDISRDPLHHFKNIYERLGLEFTQGIQREIQTYTDSSNPDEAHRHDHIKLDSKSNIYNWKNRLTDTEIKRIRDQVEYISKEFYSDDDW